MKENQYLEMKQAHQKEVNNFPVFFAFSKDQFKEGIERLGLTENDTDKIYSIGGGGYIRKADSKAFNDLFDKQDKELNKAIESDTDGTGFIFDMFYYELNNHEYIITYDVSDTLDCLGVTEKQLEENQNLKNGLRKAIKQIKKDYAEQEEEY